MDKKRQQKKQRGSAIHIKDPSGFMDDWLGDSDRAAAIVAHAMLEWTLRNSLSFMLGDGESAKYILGNDDSPGELGFASQCRLARGMGMIDDDELHDLKSVAHIRNRFAHSFERRTFDSEPIKSLCEGLRLLKEYEIAEAKIDTPRVKYQFAVMVLSSRISTELEVQVGKYDKLLKKHPELDHRKSTRIVRLQPKNPRITATS